MKRFSYFLLLLLVAACAKTDPVVQTMEPSNAGGANISYKVSEEEAITILEDFLASYTSTVTTKSELSLSNRRPVGIKALRSNNLSTKSENDPDLDLGIDTLMYAINFAEDKGFAILSADKRTEPILAIIEEGSFDEAELQVGKDDGFLFFLDGAVRMMQEDILAYEATPDTKSLHTGGYTVTSQLGPLLHTRWNQTGIYGSYCPNGIGGCVAIAVAQILSYYQTPGSVSWSYNATGGSATLHWSQIISDCDSHYGKLIYSDCVTSGNEVAHLVRYLGLSMDADYKSDATSIDRNKPIKWFNKWSNLNATSLSKYDQSGIISAIRSGKPVYACGYSKRTHFLITWGHSGGHAWVYDGVIIAKKNGVSSTFIHCNWGWGGYKNGYYLGNAFNTEEGAAIYDDMDEQYGNGSNYQYKLEYSIISR